MSGTNRFSATAASLGYAYQFRYALLVALKRQQSGPDWVMALESADDLEYSGDGDDALVQLKHRAEGTVLTDGSPDLWKTLRVWCEAMAAGSLRLPATRLLLATTAGTSPGTVCAALTEATSDRNDADLAERLREIATASTSASLQSAHDSYLSLSHEQQEQIVRAVSVLEGSPDIEAVDIDIRSLSRLMVRESHMEAFVERLEGWWNRKCLDQMVSGFGHAVHGEDFDAFLSDLREQFHQNNLPIDEDLAGERPEIEPFLERAFCRQLALLDMGVPRLGIAVRDYHRAFVQRSRWSHHGLLRYGELGVYERRLVEAWELLFERKREDLGESATDEMKLAAAKEIYAWAESADYPIRPACTEGFVSRGSLHMLADELQVGWHPDFELQLTAILDTQPTGQP